MCGLNRKKKKTFQIIRKSNGIKLFRNILKRAKDREDKTEMNVQDKI